MHAGSQAFQDGAFVIESGQHNDLKVRQSLAHSAQAFLPLHPGHPQVDDEQFGHIRGDRRDGVVERAAFGEGPAWVVILQ